MFHSRIIGAKSSNLDPFFFDKVGDIFDQTRLIYLIRDLGDDDPRTDGVARIVIFDFALRPENETAAARAVCTLYARAPHQNGARRKIGSGYVFHQFVDGDLGIVYLRDDRPDDFRKIVRRNVRRHADCDAVAAVDQQVGKARGQYARLHGSIVERGIIIHRFLIQIAQHFRREFGHSRLGITHCRGRIAVDGTELSVPVYQGKIDGEILCKPHERVVHG